MESGRAPATPEQRAGAVRRFWECGNVDVVHIDSCSEESANVKCVGGLGTIRDCSTVRYKKCLGKQVTSFEVTVLECCDGPLFSVAVGVVGCLSPLNGSMPGWQSGDVGVHLDDGQLYTGSDKAEETTAFCTRGLQQGDRVTCSMEFADSDKKLSSEAVCIAFMKNDTPIGWSVSRAVPVGGFFPAVGLLGKGAKVSVKINSTDKTPSDTRVRTPETARAEVPGVGVFASMQEVSPVSLDTMLSFQSSQSVPVGSAPLPPIIQPLDWGEVNQSMEIKDDRSVSYTGKGQMLSDVGIAVAFKPLLPSRSFFEVKISDCGEHSRIAIGLCHGFTATQASLPGWYENSVAYHGDDGYVFFGSTANGLPAGRKLQSGDVVGCGLKYSGGAGGMGSTPSTAQVFFTLNSTAVGMPYDVDIPSGGLYPVVGMLSRRGRVSAGYRSFSRSVSSQPAPSAPSGAAQSVNVNVMPVDDESKKAEKSVDFNLPNEYRKLNIGSSPGQSIDPDRSPAPMAVVAPSGPSLPAAEWTCSANITVTEVLASRTVQKCQLEFTGYDKRNAAVEFVHCGRALDSVCHSFEVSIANLAADGQIALGVAPMSAWSDSASLSHSTVLLNVSTGMVIWDGNVQYFSPVSKVGDRFTCALLQPDENGGSADIVFSRNGEAIGSIKASIDKESCYPIIALWRNGDAVVVSRDLAFDIPVWPPEAANNESVKLGMHGNIKVTGPYVSAAVEACSGVFQWEQPLSPSRPYVEVQVICSKIPAPVTIGVCSVDRVSCPQLATPGRQAGSVGFCNGNVVSWPAHSAVASSMKVDSKSSKYSLVRHMDTLGVGMRVQSNVSAGKQTIFFTHNGFIVGSVEWASRLPIIPTVSLPFGATVRVNIRATWPPPALDIPPAWAQLERIRQNHDLLCYTHDGKTDDDPGIATSSQSLSWANPYFEVEIVEPGRGCYIGVGVISSISFPQYSGMVGWKEGSVGFHADDGRIFEEEGGGRLFAPTCQQGDFMGCGVQFEAVTNDGIARPKRLFMTRNHQIIGYAKCPVVARRPSAGAAPSSTFYPMITLHSEGAIVRHRIGLQWPPPQNSLGPGIVRGALVRFSAPSTYSYTASRLENYDTGTFQAAEPLSKENQYFEVTVTEIGRGGYIGIGVACDNYPLGHQPGWGQESIALHVDDGNLFANGRNKLLCSPSVQGDVIGCGITHQRSSAVQASTFKLETHKSSEGKKALGSSGKLSQSCTIFFTRNGKVVGSVEAKRPSYGYYPTVGLHAKGAAVQVKLKAAYPPLCSLGSHWQQSVRLRSGDNGEVLSYTGRRTSQKDRGIAIARDPLEQERSFFAVTLLESGETGGDVTIGLVHENFADEMLQPGEAETSVGFHASSGGLFIAGQPSRLCCAPCGINDVIGCGVDFSLSITPGRLQSQAKANCHVYFTINGKIISRVRVACAPHLLYPAVSLHGVGDKVQVHLKNPPAVARAKHRSIGWARSHEVQLHGSMVRHLLSSLPSLHRKGESLGVAQAVLFDASRQEQYFEAILMSSGTPCNVYIGFAPLDMPVVQPPGTSQGSVMLSLASGAIYNSSDSPKACTKALFSAGDTFGCYLAWSDSESESTFWLPTNAGQVVFLHNRQEIARCVVKVPEGTEPGDLLPTIALRGKDEEVFVSVADAVVPPAIRRSPWLQFASVREDDQKRLHTISDTSTPGGVQSGFVQLCKPLTVDQPMFTVRCSNETAGVFAGVASSLFSFSQPLGRAFGSLGCDMESGMVTCEGHYVADCPPFAEDDELGIALDFADCSYLGGMPYYPVYLLRNNVIVGRSTLGVEKGKYIHPALVLTGNKASAEVELKGSLLKPLFSTVGWMQMKRMTISSYGHCLRYGGSGDSRNDAGVAIAASTLSPMNNYFEVNLCSTGRDGCIAVGLVHAEYCCDYMPGWLPGSVAYHADDGGIFAGRGTTDRFTVPCHRLDTMGCGINFSADVEDGRIEVFFTRNRQIVATESMSVPPTGIFPAVGLLSPGERVYVDFLPWKQEPGMSRLNIMVNDTAA